VRSHTYANGYTEHIQIRDVAHLADAPPLQPNAWQCNKVVSGAKVRMLRFETMRLISLRHQI